MQRPHLWLTKFPTWECTAGGVSGWASLAVWVLSQPEPGVAGPVVALAALFPCWSVLPLPIHFEAPAMVLCFPVNASAQGVLGGLHTFMISPCSPPWGHCRCCTSLCNTSLGAKGWGFHLPLKIGEEKCLHHQIPKTLINLSFPIDKADVQWERKTNEKRSEGICLLSQSSSWHSQAWDSWEFFSLSPVQWTFPPLYHCPFREMLL